MANRRKVAYAAGFIVLCWMAIAAVAGSAMILGRLLHDTTAGIVILELLIYSFGFGLLGLQAYKWRSERRSPHRSDRRTTGWRSVGVTGAQEADAGEESEAGWKRASDYETR